MKRLVIPTLLLGLFAGLTGGTWGQTPSMDKETVTLFDHKTGGPKTLPGVAIQEESSTGISLKVGLNARIQEVPAADILDIVYRVPDKTVAKAYSAAIALERSAAASKLATEKKRLTEDAVQAYQKLQPQFKGNRSAYRHMQYKVARLTARLAAEDKTLAKSAITALSRFRDDHPNSWQITWVMDKLADMQRDTGDFIGAAKTYDEMSKLKALPEEKRKRYEQEAAMALLRGKDHKTAKERLQRIRATFKPDDPQYFRLDMYIAQCDAATPGAIDKAIARLRKIILDTKETDKFRKSVAHATLGDCYAAKGDAPSLLRAIYEYLKVDLLYGSEQGGDKQEHARVCTELARLFRHRDISRPSRAKEYEEKAEMLRR